MEKHLIRKIPQEFEYEYVFQNRYSMPKHKYNNIEYELLCTNGFIKLYTIETRAYWMAQNMNGNLPSDWKFHVSIKKEQIPKAWDIIVKIFIKLKCKSGMKVIFLKDDVHVVKGREITIYIYRYDKRFGEGLKGGNELFKLSKENEQDGFFWFNFVDKCEKKLTKNQIIIQGCADGDLPIGKYFSLRNESFVLHKIILPNNEIGYEYQYPFNEDGWNKNNQRLPFSLKYWNIPSYTNKSKYVCSSVVLIILSICFVYIYLFFKN